MKARRGVTPIVIAVALTCIVLAGISGRHMLHALAYNDHDGTIEIDGRTRNYFVHTPPGYTGKTPLPLVLVLHGATESANNVERLSGMSAKADQQNFLAVYPTGTGRLKNVPTWNSGACCGYAMEHKIDDVAFVRALLERVEKDYSVDPKRIYATGISNGGMMSYRLACEVSDKFAAISPVEGAQDIPCHPTSPVSVIVFHGTADHLVPFNGGSTPYQMGSVRSDASVADTVAFWVDYDACAQTPKHAETAEVHTDIYSGCRANTAVALYAIQGGHHMWPGTALSNNGVPATDLMWTFFKDHPKQ
ncbi:MAG: PHB depolymerase family esterase [Candidatus Acidiferrales bacterium]|jgi:polyhydroxybutyrate depolymerase